MIRAVTESLIDHIKARTADLGDWVIAASLDSDAPAPTTNKLHVFLHDVEEHGHMRNQPMEATDAGYVRAPLWLRLNYVFAHASDDHLETQARLARVVEVFHTTPILRPPALRPELLERIQHLIVRLDTPTMEVRNQLWTALGRAMRLALYYQVDAVPVPPRQEQGRGRVEALDIGFEPTMS